MSYDSKWEEQYSAYLKAQVAAGKIKAFFQEPFRIILGDKCSYLPDFFVLPADPSDPMEIHEVKGFLREDAAVKFKVAAAKCPYWTFVMVSKDKSGQWVERMRLVAGVRTKSQPIDALPQKDEPGPRRKPRDPDYKAMTLDPRLAPVLKMSAASLRELRGIRDIATMADLIGMDPRSWEKIETGVTRLYHYRHVVAVRDLIDRELGK